MSTSLDRNRPPRLGLAALSTALAGTLAALGWLLRRPDPQRETRASSPSLARAARHGDESSTDERVFERRAASSAQRPASRHVDGGGLDPARAAALADEAESLTGLWMGDPHAWLAHREMTHHDKMVEAFYACGEHLRGLPNAHEEACEYEIAIVARPDGPDHGAFAYAETFHPPSEQRAQCLDFVGCLASEVWAKRSDYPASSDAVAFSVEGRAGDFLSRPLEEIERCDSFSQFMIDETLAEIAAAERAGQPTPVQRLSWNFNLQSNRAMRVRCLYAIEYKREHG